MVSGIGNVMILLDLGSLGCWLGRLEDQRGTSILVWALSDDGSSGAVQRTCRSWELVAPFSIDRRRKKDRAQWSEAQLSLLWILNSDIIMGYGGQTKPVFHKKPKTTKKIMLRLSDARVASMRRSTQSRCKHFEIGGDKKGKGTSLF
ncbi:hypothetical protein M0R45_008224 [Rubus argutus]|uniref:Uncharacterized protein n=1 Tax=Rubus argutus TaxID=59490 RepID=A0AAW1Y321_RUBAR